MKLLSTIILLSLITFQACNSTTTTNSRQIFNKEFGWTISIPENFETVSADAWSKMQNRGSDALEKTFGEKVENNTTTIFVFKNDMFNYFESNYQHFDTTEFRNYDETFNEVSKVLYQTFEDQMPNVKLDSATSKETVSGLIFNKFKTVIHLPNNMVMTCLMYSRLFGDREFTVSIMTVDEQKQKLLLDAWRKSTFN